MVDVLPTGYYLHNFLTLLNSVGDLYPDVLNESELKYIQGFRDLSQDAMRLYVRLVSRKGPHFRSDKLSYPEIADLNAAARELAGGGFLSINESLETQELAALLLRNELVDLLHQQPDFPNRAQLRAMKRPELVEQVGAMDRVLLNQLIRNQFTLYTPLGLEILQILRLLFFGNLHQDLTEFVLLDLGLLRYEDYQINEADRLFNKRAVLDQTIHLYLLRDKVYEAIENEDEETLAAIPHMLPEVAEPPLISRKNAILNRLGSWFERKREYALALDCFAQSTATPARERRARILDKLEQTQASLELCETIFANPIDALEWQFAEQFRAKLQKKLGLPSQKPKRLKHPESRFVLERDLEQRIESRVLQHFAQQGREGFYSENHFWQGLFGLAFWDIIFMPTRGAFFNRFQRGPKRLFSSEFRKQRREAVARRLEELACDPHWRTVILDRHREKQGIANYLVHWPLLPLELLERALAALDQKQVALILDRLSGNPGEFRNGFPDLFLFTDDGGYELVEVKGPGDQLQPNQRRWLRFFSENAIPYSLARISWKE